MSHFCYGETPGPAKRSTAQKLKAILLTEEEFLKLLERHEDSPGKGSKLMRPYLKHAAQGKTAEEEGWLEKVGEFFRDPEIHQKGLEALRKLPEILRWIQEVNEALGTKKRRK